MTLWLLISFAFAVPWEYSLDLGEPFGNVARICGALALLAAIPALFEGASLRRPGGLGWLVLVFYSYFALSLLWTIDAGGTIEKIRAYFQVMVMVWLVWEFANLPQDLLGMLRAFVAGCWVLAVLTFADFSSASAVAAQQIRFVAEGQDPNDVARFLDLGLPLATFLFAVERRLWIRALALAYVPCGLGAVLLTASRGGFSASLVALFGSVLLLLAWRPRAASVVLAGLAAVAGAIWSFVPEETFDRLATIPEQVGSSDLNDRLSIWISGWHAFSAAPWFGYGAGTYAAASGLSPGDTAHNTLMAILVTGGITGVGIFTGILLLTGRAVFATKHLLRIALGSAFLVWLITAMVGSVEENRTTWLLFAVMGLAGRLSVEAAGDMEAIFGFRGADTSLGEAGIRSENRSRPRGPKIGQTMPIRPAES